jgi:hypothetical protein
LQFTVTNRPEIQEALARARDEKARVQAEVTKLAIERSAITMKRVAVELGRIGFANMIDYMRIDPVEGDPVLDFSKLTREQASALTEITGDDYLEGRGETAREVRKVKFKLADKRAALMDIAKLFGWITERRENKVVDEFESMSNEEIEAWLDEHAEARVRVRHRESAEVRRRRGIGSRTLRRRASLTNIPMVGKGADGPATETGDDGVICDALLGRCCASPQMIIKEPVQRLPRGGEITPAITSEPPTSDQHVDLGLAQLDRDVSQPLSSAVPVPGHAVSARRGRGTIGRAIAYRVAHRGCSHASTWPIRAWGALPRSEQRSCCAAFHLTCFAPDVAAERQWPARDRNGSRWP